MNEILTTPNARNKFRNRIIFKNFNFSIRGGEYRSIVEPDSAGKTALLKTMSGDFLVAKVGLKIYCQKIKNNCQKVYCGN